MSQSSSPAVPVVTPPDDAEAFVETAAPLLPVRRPDAAAAEPTGITAGRGMARAARC